MWHFTGLPKDPDRELYRESESERKLLENARPSRRRSVGEKLIVMGWRLVRQDDDLCMQVNLQNRVLTVCASC